MNTTQNNKEKIIDVFTNEEEYFGLEKGDHIYLPAEGETIMAGFRFDNINNSYPQRGVDCVAMVRAKFVGYFGDSAEFEVLEVLEDYVGGDDIKEVTFNIDVEKNGKEENISFRIQCYPDVAEAEGESYNPISGWTHWRGWNQGWQEQDEELNTLLSYIGIISNDFYSEIEEFVEDAEPSDIGEVAQWQATEEELLSVDSEPQEYPDGTVNITVTIEDVKYLEMGE